MIIKYKCIRVLTLIFVIGLSGVNNLVRAQQHYFCLNDEINLRLEKILFNDSSFHSAIKPYILSSITNYDSIQSELIVEKGKRFHGKFLNSNLLEQENPKYSIYLNPILTVAPEFDFDAGTILSNYQTGLTLGAQFGKKFAFRADGFYGIQSFPSSIGQVIDSTGIVPHFGKYLSKGGGNYHYSSLSGYLSYSPWEYLNLQAGIGKNFWGDGYRSLFLSDNSKSYPFLKATVNIWRFKYLWLFGALQDYNSDFQDNKLRNKLLFSHFLSWNATKWLNFNFFESVVSNPVDSIGLTYFNISYLNPVIFFRPTEFAGGSADNALLGFGIKLKLWKKYQLYGQFSIDEFVLSEMTSGNDWWGNKYGIQAGIKVFNLLEIDNLFTRIEYNLVRPYTYSYSNSILSYSSHFQPLAHPSGANFEEFLIQIHYHIRRFSFQLKAIVSQAGMDIDSVSYGKNIFKSYELRRSDYGNTQGQGFSGSFTNLEIKTAWLINSHMNWQVFFSISYQKKYTPQIDIGDLFINLGINTLILNQNLDFL